MNRASQLLLAIVSLLIVISISIALLAAQNRHVGATIIQTQPTDTLNTFRTNVNTSLVNLNSGSTIGTIATSGNDTKGQLLYFTTTAGYPALVAGVATSAPSVTAPITYSGTLGYFVGGSAGAFDCTAASVSTKGCLTASDWARFNTATSTFSSPLVYTLSTNAVTCQTASGSQAGCLSSVDWSTFNKKLDWPWNKLTTYGTTTNATTTPEWIQGPLYASSTPSNPSVIDAITTTNGTTTNLNIQGTKSALLGTDQNGNVVSTTTIGLSVFPSIAANTVLANQTSGAAKPTAVATSSLYNFSGAFSAGATTLSGIDHPCLSVTGTTTAATGFSPIVGTTTIPIETGFGEAWNSITAFTDTGFIDFDFTNAGAHLNFVIASSTNGTTAFTTNATITSGNKVLLSYGSATSTTYFNVCVKRTL